MVNIVVVQCVFTINHNNIIFAIIIDLIISTIMLGLMHNMDEEVKVLRIGLQKKQRNYCTIDTNLVGLIIQLLYDFYYGPSHL